jgi:dimethylargininase
MKRNRSSLTAAGIGMARAIVRPPAENFAQGLTTQALGAPDYRLALEQHAAYCLALRYCGLELIELPPDPRYPDSTFVEDAAVLAGQTAVLTRPGAASRVGEVAAIRPLLAGRFGRLETIVPPGTLDGGDVCEADGHTFIGISERTNPEGARQLAQYLRREGRTSTLVDIRGLPGILHLKSGLAYIGDNRLVVWEALAGHPAFQAYQRLVVRPEEAYSANCLRVNAAILLPAGSPYLHADLLGLGYRVITLDMSEFQKMDGGLSCLSLRY